MKKVIVLCIFCVIGFIGCRKQEKKIYTLSDVSFSTSKNPLSLSYSSSEDVYISEQFVISISIPGELDDDYVFFDDRYPAFATEATAEANFMLIDGSSLSILSIALSDDYPYGNILNFNNQPSASCDWSNIKWQLHIPKSVIQAVMNSTTQRAFKANVKLKGIGDTKTEYTKEHLIGFNF